MPIIIFLFIINSVLYGGEVCLPSSHISTKYLYFEVEKPAESCSLKPQAYKVNVKNISPYALKVNIIGMEFLERKYPVSYEANFPLLYQKNFLFPKSSQYWLPSSAKACVFVPSKRIMAGEKWSFTCYYVNENCDKLKEYGNLAIFAEILAPIYSFEHISESYYIENTDKSCYQKSIQPEFYFWNPEEEGTVLLKIKNNCGIPLAEGYNNSLYMLFGSNFEPIEVLETNGKGWEILDGHEVAIYFDNFLPEYEWFAKIKVKARGSIGADYEGEPMILTLINEKDKKDGLYFEESAYTYVFVCQQ